MTELSLAKSLFQNKISRSHFQINSSARRQSRQSSKLQFKVSALDSKNEKNSLSHVQFVYKSLLDEIKEGKTEEKSPLSFSWIPELNIRRREAMALLLLILGINSDGEKEAKALPEVKLVENLFQRAGERPQIPLNLFSLGNEGTLKSPEQVYLSCRCFNTFFFNT